MQQKNAFAICEGIVIIKWYIFVILFSTQQREVMLDSSELANTLSCLQITMQVQLVVEELPCSTRKQLAC